MCSRRGNIFREIGHRATDARQSIRVSKDASFHSVRSSSRMTNGESASMQTAALECDLVSHACTGGEILRNPTAFVRSPDGRWEAFVHQNDIWIRTNGGCDSTRRSNARGKSRRNHA
jgi:hypothetical protein